MVFLKVREQKHSISIIHNWSELDTAKIPINSRVGQLILTQWWSGSYIAMKINKLKLKTTLRMNLTNLAWKVWSQKDVYHIISCMCHIKTAKVKWHRWKSKQRLLTGRRVALGTRRASDDHITKCFICGVITRICSPSTFLHVDFTSLKKVKNNQKRGPRSYQQFLIIRWTWYLNNFIMQVYIKDRWELEA